MQKRSLSSCQRGFDSVSRSSTIFYPFIHPPRPSPAARRRTSLAGAASIHPSRPSATATSINRESFPSHIWHGRLHPPRPSPAARRRTSPAGAASIRPPPSVRHGRPPRLPPSTEGASRRTSDMAVSIRRGCLPPPVAAHLSRGPPPSVRHGCPPQPPPSTTGAARRRSGMVISICRGRRRPLWSSPAPIRDGRLLPSRSLVVPFLV